MLEYLIEVFLGDEVYARIFNWSIWFKYMELCCTGGNTLELWEETGF